MGELDLHRVPHEHAERIVFNFIFSHSLPVRIITGKSEQMQEIVRKVVRENNFGCHYQFFSNAGCLIVTNSKWTTK